MRISVGPLEDFADNRCVAIADGRAIVMRVDEGVVAYENRCLHQDSPLAGGMVDNGKLTCPLHFWRYEVATGRHLGGEGMLPSYPTEVIDGEVFVEVPDPGTKLSMREMMLRHAEEWSRD